ncbi:tRNA (adenosine(37)-N6)-threonylcarbamoyltransferase complex ATPase subunit type 1 TsaE [Croceitalea sp. MTPC9]|uniref:tRNA (adenosine(37)-N6)-threonylcarbamoyltransferase complex ATPase subunit type 1 TsaE n=1 Tax=unclassified Croceitalea TaxID=2632280 RepID=UPI002B3FDF37|nr:tRNA (adenosine(37)-N6)-threonylcarbamoyltransferase complex ATPase subunit type 1 TsaE [Croceitalea sp. MTPC6]GMN15798.1 tRNA (adenosine(37)-N6)-threonylcarbamoyltransferase complex ATPase subunit type 1 TsaE [Croceitalea sp. MTPC9]
MKLQFTIEELDKVSRELLSNFNKNIICFNGPMGVGKTTLIKAIIKELGAVDSGNSPTFGLVNEYHNVNGELVAYHFDFYRINNEEEALDMGIEEYFNSNAYVFIEWPEKIGGLLPENHKKLQLHLIDENTRLIEY